MAGNADKVIVTNVSALKSKYGAQGLTKINAAVKQLITADKGRGLWTILVAVDDADAMGKLKAKAVTDATNPKQNKTTIDGVFKAIMPDYLMILGALDVIPHQDLVNPVSDDGDPLAPGDLPYACDAPYSTSIGDFTGPTRVVGRLPDVTGGDDPDVLVGLLRTAAAYQGRPVDTYNDYLGISAEVWKASTAMSLQAAFGASSELQVSPPDGPDGVWPANLIGRWSHFINCHGASNDDRFYGQHGEEFPVALNASHLLGKITEGTVISAECCYGAQLWDPANAVNGPKSICTTYLAEKAYAFFGSSTIAYGPSDQNDSADLICQFFIKHIREGSSTGRAALQARLDFISARSPLDPYNTKTLGQFNLLGDPSVHPVVSAHAAKLIAEASPRKGKAMPAMVPSLAVGPDIFGASRSLRRYRLGELGRAIGSATRVVHRIEGEFPTKLKRAMLDAFKEIGGAKPTFHSYSVGVPVRAGRAAAKTRAKAMAPPLSSPVSFHVAHVKMERKETAKNPSPTLQHHALVAIEVDGTYILKHLFSR